MSKASDLLAWFNPTRWAILVLSLIGLGLMAWAGIEMLIGVGEKRVQAKWDKAKSEAIEIQGKQNTTATKEVIVTETITETKYRDRIKEVIRYVPKLGTTCPADDEFVRLFNAD